MTSYMDWLEGAGRWLFGPKPEERSAPPAEKQYTDSLAHGRGLAQASEPPPAVLTRELNFGHGPALAEPARDMALYESEPGRYSFPQERQPLPQRPAQKSQPPPKAKPQPAATPRAQPRPSGLDSAAFWRQQDSARFADGGSAKVEKAAAHYQDTPNKGQACAACSMFEAPHTCTAVKGFIARRGWCDYWERQGRKAGGRVHKQQPPESRWSEAEKGGWAAENPRIQSMHPESHLKGSLDANPDAVMPHINPYALEETHLPWRTENKALQDRTPRAYAPGGAAVDAEMLQALRDFEEWGWSERRDRSQRHNDVSAEEDNYPRDDKFEGVIGTDDPWLDGQTGKGRSQVYHPDDLHYLREGAATEMWEGPPSLPNVHSNFDEHGRWKPQRKDGGAVAAAAAQVERNPTEAQKEAGNYAKGHLTLHGFDIAIENPKGGTRSGMGKDGKKWSVSMPAHYGYLKRTEGKDGDHVDVYIGPDHASKRVFVVDQINAESGKFDEHKCMLSYKSKAAALADYKAAFSDGKGADRIGSVAVLSIDSFRDWLKHGNTKKPLGRRAYADGGAIQHSLDQLGSRLPTREDSGGRR